MAATIGRQRTRLFTALLALLIAAAIAATPARVQAADTPRRGGILLAVIGAEPPSLDPHQEGTFANIQLVAPCYSLLLQFDPRQLLEDHRRRRHRVEDRARRADLHVQDPAGDPLPRRLAADGRRRQGQLRQDHLRRRPGVGELPEEQLLGGRAGRGPRPDHRGVPAQVPVGLPPRQPGVAVERDLPEEVPGPGPQLLQDARRGLGAASSSRATRTARRFEGERNPDYFIKDRPYLDGYKFFISTETSVRAAAIRSGRAYVEFRDLPGAEVEAIKKQLGDKVVVQETPVSATGGSGSTTP